MKTSDFIRSASAAGVPALIVGPPGAGKTRLIEAEAKKVGAHIETLVGSVMDPVDMAGQPYVSRGDLRVAPPAWAVRIRSALDEGRSAWLFLDELSCAPPAVQAAMLRLVLDRRAGEIDITGCWVCAAANPADTAADVGWLAPPMRSRLAHYTYEVDSSEWVTGQLSGWGTPMSRSMAAAASGVCGYIRRHPSALMAEKIPDDGPYPCPRSWSAAIALLAVSPQSDALDVATSAVGRGAAQQYHTWVLAQDLPDPEDILSGSAKLPDRGDQLAAALIAVAGAAMSDHAQRKDRVIRAWEVLSTVRPDQQISASAALLNGFPDYVPPSARKLAEKIGRAEK